MSSCGAFICHESDDFGASVRALLSLREAVVLAEVPESRVRKDIDTGVLAPPRILRFGDARLCVNWIYAFTLAAVYGNTFLNARLRKSALDKVDRLYCGGEPLVANVMNDLSEWRRVVSAAVCHDAKLTLDRYVLLDLGKVCEEVRPRVTLYASGLSKIEEKEGVLSGDAVFKNTRLSVCHVGKMYERGETIANILSDYPYLTEDDVKFARLYFRAHPPVGRPRMSGEAERDHASTVG